MTTQTERAEAPQGSDDQAETTTREPWFVAITAKLNAGYTSSDDAEAGQFGITALD